MRCPLTRARICALMYPTSVPTYSTEIGTSCSVTEATLTTGSWGADAAPDFWLQPASAAARTTASTATENSLVFIVCTAQAVRICRHLGRVNRASASEVTDVLAFR